MNLKDIARMSMVILIKLKVLFSLADIHASGSSNEQCIFFQRVGDFNVTLSVDMCGIYGKPRSKQSGTYRIKNLRLTSDFINIWRIKNLDFRRFTCTVDLDNYSILVYKNK